ncbi:hypothetical protein BHE74_00018946 [Ensete ventricosum]|uniref:Uncharacterized protein n=1 Tax=Ensete ventricosum TaxID=4639 RepID=A0A427A0C4_ENSVE|nr:hypothetical protein B296_00005264 [Ensete ventricosum]RWW73197.1 hypothetical protein BHE74_00018946 [Ensete ventricosum]RZR80713.1 hypothetical protein BHM03_00006795 [Ensete ventricosum]
MEKAINRQRVLLQHLQPFPSSSSSLISVSGPVLLVRSVSIGSTRVFGTLGFLDSIVAFQASVCAAGDSAAYQRNSCFGDDVVVVA